MHMRIKRTYNLSPAAIETVKRLVEIDHVAGTQDALVERAIGELDRIIRDARDAQLWVEASRDADFQAEITQIEMDLPHDDSVVWDS
ncbi:MAG TPA: hypothetical protein VNL35_03855 [Chloroflexota bacterium]|nr:hypothetical protein [Chloroflexota bacterium]